MSYTVLARKYRPQVFADLVGQEHVSRTLGHAIEGGRVAHAFLFTGARGVGKTTTARLLAKALNCEKGPTPTPCGVCDACREIASGVDLDVLEIDGASNNGVDDVRRLQETLPFRPARDRFKIVIVDEVHMLSTGAFNAFLKTLEEPPSHVKFIFATTEVHKVPITIRSRCQRYDFRLIPHAVVASRVRDILAAEKVDADDAAIALVAREAAGSMRDALTVLDQLLALGGTTLRGETVASGLGIASRDHVFGCVDALLSGDAAECLRSVNLVVDQGLDVLHFARQLLESVRDLVVLRVVGDADPLVDLAPDELERAKQMIASRERPELERLFAGLGKLVEEVGEAGMPQMTLEMGLVRLADRPPLVALADLVERLRGIEQRLLAGASGSGAGGGGSGGGGGPGSRPSAPAPVKRGSGPEVAPRSSRTSGIGATPGASAALPSVVPASAGSAGGSRAVLAAAEAAVHSRDQVDQVERARGVSGVESSVVDPSLIDQVAVCDGAAKSDQVAKPEARRALIVAPDRDQVGETQPGDRVAADQVVETPAKRDPVGFSESDQVGEESDSTGLGTWPMIVSNIKATHPALGAVLDHGVPLEVTTAALRIGFPEGSFFGRQAQNSGARDAILRAAEQVLGARPVLTFGAPGDAKIGTLAQRDEAARRTRSAAKREAALSHPRVMDAMEVFEESEGSVDVQVDLE